MEKIGILAMQNMALQKIQNYKSNLAGYFIYSIMAGLFVGLGMVLAYSAAGEVAANQYTAGFGRIVFGISFSLSFTLIIYAGSELFTGNLVVLTIGVARRSTKLYEALKLLFLVFIGNFIGATFIAILVGLSGLLENQNVSDYIALGTTAKMNLTFTEALIRGILCNMLVCLATWSISKLKSEPAKMLILIWAVYGFCTSGYEHSIANMSLFIMAYFSPQGSQIFSWSGYLGNIIPVTLGNIIGGIVFVGLMYFWISYKSTNKDIEINIEAI